LTIPDTQNSSRAAWWQWAIVLGPGALLFFFPLPGLTEAQGRLLAVFLSTIVALVVQPVPMGVSVLVAMTLLAVTRTLTPAKALSGFSNITVWLIFTAFLFSRAVTATGFGLRIGYLFIRQFARTPLSLGYSVAGANLFLAPFIPSDTARGGGVIFPIVRSLCTAFESEPGPTGNLIGRFLILVGFHTTYATSGIYLTGMAANPLIAEFAMKVAHVDLTWGRWLAGSIVPGFLTLTIVPWLLLRMTKPELVDTRPARELARMELHRMGPLTRGEKWLSAIMFAVMVGWVTSPQHGIPNTFVALMGLSALLLTRVLTWDELLAEKRAWDALIWFAPLIMMSDALNEGGTIKILSARLFGSIAGWPWMLVLIALALTYLYVHYAFASMTAHVTALYPAFLAAMVTGGVPPMLAALVLAYFSNLNAAMTHYGTGSAPVFFGPGYLSQGEWWRIGFIISVVNVFIWLGVGLAWWKAIGLW
jgi:DASS family divalent anion:Na+ symporter